MIEHPLYGLSLQEHGWVPSPRYAMRRDRVLHHVAALAPGRVLEIGCGPGALLHDLAKRGHRCTALESSPQALEILSTLYGHREEVEVFAEPQAWSEPFDLLLAFEVLEHIEDDRAALREWASWMRDGATLMLSVPAHQRLWNATDEWAGHYRRYGSQQLRDLAEAVGLEVSALECYGFPLANVLEQVRARTWVRRGRGDGERSQDEHTAASGVDRGVESRLYPLLASPPGALAMRAFFRLQERFARTELGNGFLLVARKRPT